MTTARITLRITSLLYIVLLLILIFTSCSQHKILTQTKDGISVEIKNPLPGSAKRVRLQAISPKIIRVTAGQNSRFSSAQSLMTDSTFHSIVEWSTEQTANEVILKTGELAATVSLTTGEVVFKDKNGNIILQEKTGGGKEITPVVIDEKPLYTIRQQFESPAGEAF